MSIYDYKHLHYRLSSCNSVYKRILMLQITCLVAFVNVFSINFKQ